MILRDLHLMWPNFVQKKVDEACQNANLEFAYLNAGLFYGLTADVIRVTLPMDIVIATVFFSPE